jgi:hypothetical protein
MKAAVYGAQGLEIRELEKPRAKAGQLLVGNGHRRAHRQCRSSRWHERRV